jgi:hypothetical protein
MFASKLGIWSVIGLQHGDDKRPLQCERRSPSCDIVATIYCRE